MSEHTASTRHLVDIVVTADGDDGITADELQDIIEDAIEGVDGLEHVSVRVTDDIGLGAENFQVVYDAESEDPAVFGGDKVTFTDAEGFVLLEL